MIDFRFVSYGWGGVEILVGHVPVTAMTLEGAFGLSLLAGGTAAICIAATHIYGRYSKGP
jgi:hypothetical protein